VIYHPAASEVPVERLRPDLDLTRGPNWGYALRRGLLELSAHDGGCIAEAMGAADVGAVPR
jgi:hypothetical protein